MGSPEPALVSAAAPAPADMANQAVAWAVPGQHGSPAEALARIGALCRGHADLFSALFAVLATHQGVARELLAASVQQFRPELAALSRDDVVGLLTGILHGGRPGFEAVLRSRQRGERRATALPWVRD